MQENEKQAKKDDKPIRRPPVKTGGDDITQSGSEKGKTFSKASGDVVKGALTILNIGMSSDAGDFFAVYRRKKKYRRSGSSAELIPLHKEFPALAQAIQRYRGFREENPMPKQSEMKERPRAMHQELYADVGQFGSYLGHKKPLNDSMIAITDSLKPMLGLFKKAGESDMNPNVAPLPNVGVRYLKSLRSCVTGLLGRYANADAGEHKNAYRNELLGMKKLLDNALLLAVGVGDMLKGGDASPDAKRKISDNANSLLNALQRSRLFFDSVRGTKQPQTQRRVGVSSNVIGKKSEKAKLLNHQRAQIVDTVINRFCEIIESEDTYETKLDASKSAQSPPSIESIREQYQALQKYMDVFGITPELLLSQRITGRKSQMTALAKYIAF